jgi:Lon-like protease
MMRLRRPRRPIAFAAAFAICAGGFTYGWETQSGYYAVWPDTAHPAVSAVRVPGGTAPSAGSGFYFVDVHVLQANLLEQQYFSHFVSGADLIPVSYERAPGESETQRLHVDLQAMATSQQIAQAVAEQVLGHTVGYHSLGLFVTDVAPHDPAAKAGVSAGDVLLKVNGIPVPTPAALTHATAGIHPGQLATYTFRNAGKKELRTVAAPGSSHHAIIGIGVGEAVRITHLPIHVHFATQGIGGPSAGLAFTLEIYDSLSGRKLLHGHRIAVTGTISLDGSVGAIGGVKQKTIGAIEAGADTFLVPQGQNYRDARAEAGSRIRVIAVTSFRDALRMIRTLPLEVKKS